MNKREILLKFAERYKDLAKQGSKQWIEERHTIIGGSEMSIITGDNQFSSIPGLISQKVGLTTFNGNTATRWGCLFERISEILFNEFFVQGDIINTGSIQNKKISNHRYSPDGLCILNIANEDKVALLEFKAPLSSIPAAIIPKYYLPQVKSGLCTIDIADVAVFVNNMYRKCPLHKLDWSSSYDLQFHKNLELETPISNGIILFAIPQTKISALKNYLSVEIDSDTVIHEEDNDFISDTKSDTSEYMPMYMLDKIQHLMDLNQKKLSSETILDLGDESKENFEIFLELHSLKFINATYVKPQINEDLNGNFIKPEELQLKHKQKKYNYFKTIDSFISKSISRGDIPLAVLPWKLFKSSVILQEKEPDYLDKHEEKINDIVNLINSIRSDSRENTIQNFMQVFPDSDMLKEIELRDCKVPDYIKPMLN